MENLGFLKNRWQYRERRRYLRVPGGKWRCHAKEKRRTRDKQTKLAFSVDLERESRVRERVCMKRFILLIQIIKLYKIKKKKQKEGAPDGTVWVYEPKKKIFLLGLLRVYRQSTNHLANHLLPCHWIRVFLSSSRNVHPLDFSMFVTCQFLINIFFYLFKTIN